MIRNWIIRILSFGFLAGIILSWQLWTTFRQLPLVPVLPLIPSVQYIQELIAIVLVLSLIFTIIKPNSVSLVTTGAVALLVFFDINRLQPWVYQYTFMLTALALYKGKQKLTGIHICQIIVAGVYIWSGIHKLNPLYESTGLPWFLSGSRLNLDAATIRYYAPVTGIAEALAGLLLLVPRARWAGIVFIMGLHVLVIWCLSPWNLNWNQIVWPWNITFLLLLPLLFWPKVGGKIKDYLPTPKKVWFLNLSFALFGVLPALHLWNRWDAYLSAALYTANVDLAYIDLNRSVEAWQFPQSMQGKSRLDLTLWSMDTMNVPPYIAAWNYKRIYREFCKQEPRLVGQMIISTKQGLGVPQQNLTVNCGDVM